MTKAYSIFLTVLFTVFIGGVLVISALLPKEEFSEMENRFLQKPPELSIETVKNGKFMENAEKYVSDHIAGRRGGSGSAASRRTTGSILRPRTP